MLEGAQPVMWVEMITIFMKSQAAWVIAAALGALLCVLVFGALIHQLRLSGRLKRALKQLAAREMDCKNIRAEQEAQALLARQMAGDLEELRKRFAEKESLPSPAYSLWGTDGGLNLNRKGQILKLARKGKSISEIASDLNTSQGEVELLLKIQDLGQKNPDSKS